ncbi:3',5'-cyclic AMP phosphodiesterase CpdA [Compostimonas suwonensis]|uniref:3',5'-cyclic AMP phosphodiesterase CpdA n=2 Tax=Compostimonas suwonensis TaxID=1048394 RepID=A0A2M9BCB2_9MICO|nr:3',5'-cyclic AMP phosphodiesterase CpdA [Compostimonas suwonensis]
MVLDDHGAAIVTDVEHTVIAPGLDRVSLRRLSSAGPLHAEILVAKLGGDSPVHADYLYPGAVSQAEKVRDLITRQGAVAGVNGSFFDINNTNAPNGIGISKTDGIVTAPDGSGEGSQPVTFGEDGLGSIAQLMLEGSVDLGAAGTLAISGVNTAVLGAGHIALFNSTWGEGNRARVLQNASGPADPGVEVWVVDGKVTKVTAAVGSGAIPAGTQILVARGAGANLDALSALAVGDAATISYGLSANAGNVVAAIGANQTLLTDGTVTNNGDASVEPRTGVGFSDNGQTMYLALVDGRQTTSIGMKLTQFGQLFKDLGAEDAVNLDGGGSSTILAREAGDEQATLLHNPSDGEERLVPNGLGLFVAPGSGTAHGYRLVAEHATDDAQRVFPGLHRTLTAKGYDEMYAPVTGTDPAWTAESDAVSITELDGPTASVEGKTTGDVAVDATSGEATGTMDVQVLGALQRVTASTSLVALVDKTSVGTLTLVGHDDQGYEAPIDPADVTITGNEAGKFAITPGEGDTFSITPLVDEDSTELHFDVQGKKVDVALTVGVSDAPISTFDDVATWRVTTARATAQIGSDAGRTGGTSVHLTYDFSQQTGTRTANALPPARYDIPGQPQNLKVWVKGTSTIGANAETYLGYRDATGSTKFVYSSAPVGNGWQQINFPIPQGTAYPIQFTQVAAYETNADQLYRGEMWFDDATAEVAPNVELPIAPLVTSDVIASDGATDDDAQRVAIISDAQFIAANPTSGQVQAAHRTLKEIVASKPDVMFLVGDFVDEASPADFALAKSILDEELAGVDFPWYYLPGNHEIMGTSDLTNFRNVFGDPVKTVDQDGTRFILLDASTGTLSKNFPQLQMLRSQLDDAKTNPDITGVVVLQHMPIDDPLVNKASQLVNRQDAEMEREWLEDFRESSGKSIAMVNGHVGTFHSKVEDGIPYIINGNSGKTPSESPEFGEFTGWTMIGIDPAAGEWRKDAAAPAVSSELATSGNAWLEAETQTRVDELDVTAPTSPIASGSSVELAPTVTQDTTRVRDVLWPMSWAWTGSDSLFVGPVADAPADAIAAIDPSTHVLTGLHAGSGEATLTMNGVSTTAQFEVTGGVVSVTGDPAFGSTLIADLSALGAPDGATVGYQWLRDGEPIDGATTASYAAGVDDLGAKLSVTVTVSADGLATVSTTSDETVAIAAIELPRTPEVTITGEATVGETLTAAAGDWGVPDVAIGYNWLRDGEPVADAAAASYTLTDADLGAHMSVTATATAPGYEPKSVTSDPTGAVAPADVTDPTDTPTDTPSDEPTTPPSSEPTSTPSAPASDNGDSGSGTADGDLASTGFDGLPYAALAALLLALGAGTVLFRRSRAAKR